MKGTYSSMKFLPNLSQWSSLFGILLSLPCRNPKQVVEAIINGSPAPKKGGTEECQSPSAFQSPASCAGRARPRPGVRALTSSPRPGVRALTSSPRPTVPALTSSPRPGVRALTSSPRHGVCDSAVLSQVLPPL